MPWLGQTCIAWFAVPPHIIPYEASHHTSLVLVCYLIPYPYLVCCLVLYQHYNKMIPIQGSVSRWQTLHVQCSCMKNSLTITIKSRNLSKRKTMPNIKERHMLWVLIFIHLTKLISGSICWLWNEFCYSWIRKRSMDTCSLIKEFLGRTELLAYQSVTKLVVLSTFAFWNLHNELHQLKPKEHRAQAACPCKVAGQLQL